ncbi:uncharacterized protein STEHIDRAFT_111029 [Stereum hirsutum FP-91666 SS1]|uniref:uncharacterized protein n=1 Tax=Stereum hirsutum (strain FP-91666) TaxID=721885 RepID=UPI000440DC23|nr:uncharacterized protein STEHIDRAFT_111029 [Stereum hirsutum FP-91666 SS1]EIM86545.1 hypothetical protein STEHIDRAFT_111029 [Stereum hirsutum FP-91666 SS1]
MSAPSNPAPSPLVDKGFESKPLAVVIPSKHIDEDESIRDQLFERIIWKKATGSRYGLLSFDTKMPLAARASVPEHADRPRSESNANTSSTNPDLPQIDHVDTGPLALDALDPDVSYSVVPASSVTPSFSGCQAAATDDCSLAQTKIVFVEDPVDEEDYDSDDDDSDDDDSSYDHLFSPPPRRFAREAAPPPEVDSPTPQIPSVGTPSKRSSPHTGVLTPRPPINSADFVPLPIPPPPPRPPKRLRSPPEDTPMEETYKPHSCLPSPLNPLVSGPPLVKLTDNSPPRKTLEDKDAARQDDCHTSRPRFIGPRIEPHPVGGVKAKSQASSEVSSHPFTRGTSSLDVIKHESKGKPQGSGPSSQSSAQKPKTEVSPFSPRIPGPPLTGPSTESRPSEVIKRESQGNAYTPPADDLETRLLKYMQSSERNSQSRQGSAGFQQVQSLTRRSHDVDTYDLRAIGRFCRPVTPIPEPSLAGLSSSRKHPRDPDDAQLKIQYPAKKTRLANPRALEQKDKNVNNKKRTRDEGEDDLVKKSLDEHGYALVGTSSSSLDERELKRLRTISRESQSRQGSR